MHPIRRALPLLVFAVLVWGLVLSVSDRLGSDLRSTGPAPALEQHADSPLILEH